MSDLSESERQSENLVQVIVIGSPVSHWTTHYFVAFESKQISISSFGRVLHEFTAVVPDAISFNWQDLATSKLSEETYQYLLELALYKSDWHGPRSRSMSASSLSSFLKFWKKVRRHAAEPELVLTPQGSLQAEWSRDKKHYLEIDFRGENENALFGLFDGPKTVIEGAAPLEDIYHIIMSRRKGAALKWQSDAD